MGYIRNAIERIIPRRYSVIANNAMIGSMLDIVRRDYATLIWQNMCDIVADLLEDTSMSAGNMSAEGMAQFAQYRAFVFAWGRVIWQRLWDDGYCVIAYSGERGRFWVMTQQEYTIQTEGDVTTAKAYDQSVQVYVMRSATFIMRGISDRAMCASWLNFLDDICNSSATVNRRMGAMVVAAPKNLTNAPTATVLTKDKAEEMQKEISEGYGSLPKQSNLLILPREMSWQTINLAGLDLKTLDKAKFCILAICDRLKIPANQVAIVDAMSAKTLANGGEIREGDRLKYATFRRMFERTFADMARDLGLAMTYTIAGEPTDEKTTTTTV